MAGKLRSITKGAGLHLNYESAKEFPLKRQENKAVKLDRRVGAMKVLARWGERTREPSSLRFAAPGPARQQPRPTTISSGVASSLWLEPIGAQRRHYTALTTASATAARWKG